MKQLLTYILAFLITITTQGCFETLQDSSRYVKADPWSEPVWGLPAEGLQCCLTPDKRIWQQNEIPTFKFDLLNNGKSTFAFWPANKHQICSFHVDNKWYNWPRPTMIESQTWPLTPGASYKGVTIELNKTYGAPLKLGKHIIRIAVNLEGLQAISNPVGIEIKN